MLLRNAELDLILQDSRRTTHYAWDYPPCQIFAHDGDDGETGAPPGLGGRREARWHLYCAAAGDRRHPRDFVPLLEAIAVSAEEAIVLFVDIDIEKRTHLDSRVSQVS